MNTFNYGGPPDQHSQVLLPDNLWHHNQSVVGPAGGPLFMGPQIPYVYHPSGLYAPASLLYAHSQIPIIHPFPYPDPFSSNFSFPPPFPPNLMSSGDSDLADGVQNLVIGVPAHPHIYHSYPVGASDSYREFWEASSQVPCSELTLQQENVPLQTLTLIPTEDPSGISLAHNEMRDSESLQDSNLVPTEFLSGGVKEENSSLDIAEKLNIIIHSPLQSSEMATVLGGYSSNSVNPGGDLHSSEAKSKTEAKDADVARVSVADSEQDTPEHQKTGVSISDQSTIHLTNSFVPTVVYVTQQHNVIQSETSDIQTEQAVIQKLSLEEKSTSILKEMEPRTLSQKPHQNSETNSKKDTHRNSNQKTTKDNKGKSLSRPRNNHNLEQPQDNYFHFQRGGSYSSPRRDYHPERQHQYTNQVKPQERLAFIQYTSNREPLFHYNPQPTGRPQRQPGFPVGRRHQFQSSCQFSHEAPRRAQIKPARSQTEESSEQFDSSGKSDNVKIYRNRQFTRNS